MRLNGLKKIACICFFSSLATACANSDIIALNSKEHDHSIDATITQLYSNDGDKEINLSLDDAIHKATSDNFDVQVAEYQTLIATDNVSLEYLQTLPSVKIGSTLTHRDNDAASSSRSILTGTQSLEPSTSADRTRRLSDLEAQWNLTDAVIAYTRGRSASDREKIMTERLRKVRHDIERDVAAAYWRSYNAQENLVKISDVNNGASKIMNNLEIADAQNLLQNNEMMSRHTQLTTKHSRILSLHEQLQSADTELKTMIGLSPKTSLNLISTPNEFNHDDNHYGDIDNLITTALKNRPEMREQYLNQNIAARQITQEIIDTFPGLNLVYSLNYDSNSFLTDSNWQNMSAALSQSLGAFLSLSKRTDVAQAQYQLEDKRRLALAAAIIAQIHINKSRIIIAQKQYDLANMRYNRAVKNKQFILHQHELGAQSSYHKILADIDEMEAKNNQMDAFMNLYNANADMRYTIGISSFEMNDEKEL